MAVRLKGFSRVVVPIAFAIAIAVLSLVLGQLITGGSGVQLSTSSSAPQEQNAAGSISYDTAAGGAARSSMKSAPPENTFSAGVSSGQAADSAAPAPVESASLISAPSSILVRNASVDSRVTDVEAAVKRIRAIVAAQGAEITDLSVFSGDQGPRPLAEGMTPQPTNASLTIRVPAEKLEQLRAQVAKVGRVLSQSASANDVTQQYVDMEARLTNLKAEEARLRSLFNKATKVSDLLAVESELARVRGEIESLQAQFDVLKRQVAMSTLTVTLSEPSPVVQPANSDWGFREAITRGIQGAVGVLTTTITGLIALVPVAALAFVAWLVIIAVRRRFGRKNLNSGATEDDDVPME